MGAGERDEFLRAAWRLLVAGQLGAARLVFVDEMGANVSLSPIYAWSRRGERASSSAPRNWGKNVTLLASITAEGVGPCLAVEGATTREVFEAYLERALAPELKPGLVVVMDNHAQGRGAHSGGARGGDGAGAGRGHGERTPEGSSVTAATARWTNCCNKRS
ncbi:MAG TPA: transposase [Rubrobacter sp.]|nr:transposase [Rubrobacter sp.]